MIRGPRAGRPSTIRFSYDRVISEERCPHNPEPHVVYDLLASGYRAQLRCRCGSVWVESSRVRDRCALAERDGDDMLRIAVARAEAEQVRRRARRG